MSSTAGPGDAFVVDLPAYADYGGPYGPGRDDMRIAGDRNVGGGCVWFEQDNGTRLSVLWPQGWQARFFPTGTGPPTFEVLDDTGTVVGHQGDRISAAGWDTDETDFDRRCVVTQGTAVGDVTGPQIIEVLDIFVTAE